MTIMPSETLYTLDLICHTFLSEAMAMATEFIDKLETTGCEAKNVFVEHDPNANEWIILIYREEKNER